MMTLIGAAIAGGLIWLATWIGPMESTGQYWAAMGCVAAAGLVMALSQLAGGWTKWGLPSASPNVFALAFLPALIVGGWILLAAQPEGGGVGRERVLDWSASLGLTGLVTDLTTLVGAIAFGLGLVFGLVFDTTGPRYRDDLRYPDDRRVADEPTTAERRRATTAEPDVVDAGREPVAVGAPDGRVERETPSAPQPVPEDRPRRRSFFRR
ncbi:MAG: hypothetical protein ICV67_07030 [Thermoleophilia bacterium]|nr:hypothetical protein [Thermoleophilia bacterium]